MLSKFLIVLSILVLVVMIMFFLRGKSSKKGTAPGIIEGKLAKCSRKPNAVCSEFIDDKKHYVEPIDVKKVNMGQHFHKLIEAIEANGGEVIKQTDNYVAATFTSAIFRFVDDVEARLDKENGLIHLRSASREGYSDLGVNAKRIDKIKATYAA